MRDEIRKIQELMEAAEYVTERVREERRQYAEGLVLHSAERMLNDVERYLASR